MIEGRVVDAEGRPVAGARVVVWLHDWVATTDENGTFSFTSELDAQRERVRVFDSAEEFTLRATDGQRASWPVTVDWNGARLQAPDLVLHPGIMACITVRWNDGTPATGVKLSTMVSDDDRTPDDERNSIVSHKGATNEQGAWRFGPIPDTVNSVFVSAKHPAGPPVHERWDGHVCHPLELVLRRGRAVRGRLVTPAGVPAEGYRVAPFGPGDPDRERVVKADADGNFEIPSADPGGAVIGVFNKLPPLPTAEMDEAEALSIMMARVGSPGNPILFMEAPPGETDHDFGTIELPVLGTLTLQLEDSRGGVPRSGHVFWKHATHTHGGRAENITSGDGVVRFEHVPVGIAILLQATIEDAQLGEIEQSFGIECVTEDPVRLRVSGAGTVIIRLHPKGAPDKALIVEQARAEWHQYHGMSGRQSSTSELRGCSPPGFYPELRIRAKGHEDTILTDIVVRDDGPTFLDAELEPR